HGVETMNPGEKLPDDAVRWAKRQLLAKTSQETVARALRVSVNTIGRIKRGVTYQHVVVEGEERLRKPLEVTEACDGKFVQETHVVHSWEPSQTEVEASLARLSKEMAKLEAAEAKPPADPDSVEEAKRRLGL